VVSELTIVGYVAAAERVLLPKESYVALSELLLRLQNHPKLLLRLLSHSRLLPRLWSATQHL
jgi:hypothetical protein